MNPIGARVLRQLALSLSVLVLAAGVDAQAQPAKDYEPRVGQEGKDVVWVPTPQPVVNKMLDMAKVTPKDYVIDLGSGDGRTVITVAKRGVKAGEANGRTLAAKRLVMRDLVSTEVLEKLFDQLAPRFMERPGGYTRILRLGHRRGDGGEIAQIELVGSEYDPKKAEAAKAEVVVIR